MLTINGLFYFDFFVFGVFAALLSTEIMGSVVLLLWWNKYKTPVLKYIVPVWEVTGTFGAFWVVFSDLAFPGILIPLASIYAGAIMIFLILFVARNTSISFAEFIIKKGWLDERKLYIGYSLASIFIGIVVLYILSGIIGGHVTIYTWFGHAEDLLFVLGTVVILVGLAPVFFGVPDLKKASLLFTVIGVVISITGAYLFKSAASSFLPVVVIVPIVLTILPAVLFYVDKLRQLLTNKLFFIGWLSVDLFSLSFMVYPKFMGGTMSVDSLTASGPMVGAITLVSILGGIILAILVAIYVLAEKKKGVVVAEHP